MSTPAEILVIRHLSDGIYQSAGGGESRVVSRHVSGPRGFLNARRSHYEDCRTAPYYYGNIGQGSGWVEIVPKGGNPGDGVTLEYPLDHYVGIPVGADLEWWQAVDGHIGAAMRWERI